MNYYKDDTLYNKGEIVTFINQNKEKINLLVDNQVFPNTCFGCYFHNIFINNCTRPHAKCCSPDGMISLIFKCIDSPKTFERFDKDYNKKKLIY